MAFVIVWVRVMVMGVVDCMMEVWVTIWSWSWCKMPGTAQNGSLSF